MIETSRTSMVEEMECGSFFDQIDDIIDFPSSYPSISSSSPSLHFSLPPFEDDIVEPEWLSDFVDDSFSVQTLTINNDPLDSSYLDNLNSDHHLQFHSSSPVSVLESSSSCSADKTAPSSPEFVASARRSRSKRPRPPTFPPRPAMHLISPSSSVNESGVPHSDSENFAESRLLIKIPKQILSEEKKKKKKIKFSVPLASAEVDQNSATAQKAVRKCMHCEITTTPQWRAGPLGPKTLCNACGVRYKSGRLFPEYRPAASPTFVPSLHSNSHKKVVEMRNRVVQNNSSMDGAMTANSPELIPNNCNIVVDYM